MLTAANVRWVRRFGRTLLRQAPLTGGASLVAQLLHLNLRRSTEVWLHCPLQELIVRDGRVQHGRTDRLGDGIRAGMAVGAASALMDDAWWGPALLPGGIAVFTLRERSFPSSIIVDRSGERFMNESASYVECGHRIYERNDKVPAIPAWLIIHDKHRRRYPFVMLHPGRTPDSVVDSGFLRRAGSLADLARQIGVDPQGLSATVQRFNRFAVAGRDEDFHRGDTAYDRFYGDPRVAPNPNLGTM